ncbi:MAG: hypothetical protein ACRDST_08110 [Pseudonocardiaceae bacterium]
MVVGETDGPEAILTFLDTLDGAQTRRFQPAWVARAHLLAGAGDTDAAQGACDKAISLTANPATRASLTETRKAL